MFRHFLAREWHERQARSPHDERRVPALRLPSSAHERECIRRRATMRDARGSCIPPLHAVAPYPRHLVPCGCRRQCVVCRSHSIHVQAKIVQGPSAFRLFETGLYLEHEALPSVSSIHINVSRSGARASHTRDRTFVGFDALDFEASTEAAQRLADVMMPHIESIGPHAAALLVRDCRARIMLSPELKGSRR